MNLTDEARVNAAVAQLIYAARNQAGLSQAELAERIGTKQSVISRLEDADSLPICVIGRSLSDRGRTAAIVRARSCHVDSPPETPQSAIRGVSAKLGSSSTKTASVPCP